MTHDYGSLGFGRLRSRIGRTDGLLTNPKCCHSEWLQPRATRFSHKRQRFCRKNIFLDCRIRIMLDATAMAFRVQSSQRSARELHDAVQQKNFAKGLPEVYLRKLPLLKTKPEYICMTTTQKSPSGA